MILFDGVCNFCNLHCPAGKFHTGCGGGSKGACVACAAGKHKQHAGWHSCSDCAPGRYHAGSAASKCTDCASGQYSTAAGAAACVACDKRCAAGTYHSGCGGASKGWCLSCPRGQFKTGAGASLTRK